MTAPGEASAEGMSFSLSLIDALPPGERRGRAGVPGISCSFVWVKFFKKYLNEGQTEQATGADSKRETFPRYNSPEQI